MAQDGTATPGGPGSAVDPPLSVTPPADRPMRVVVLVSGEGTNLQALLDAGADAGFGATVVAVGADRDGTGGLARARAAGLPGFVRRVGDSTDRATWDAALAADIAANAPDLVVCAGFLKLLGPAVLGRFPGRVLNTHPALLPSFPGMHGPRDALAYGVKVSGATLFVVDAGVDTGGIVAQRVVDVLDDDDAATLHERIKVAERQMLVDAVGAMARGGWTVDGRRVTLGAAADDPDTPGSRTGTGATGTRTSTDRKAAAT